jgi:hypothetical protein
MKLKNFHISAIIAFPWSLSVSRLIQLASDGRIVHE